MSETKNCLGCGLINHSSTIFCDDCTDELSQNGWKFKEPKNQEPTFGQIKVEVNGNIKICPFCNKKNNIDNRKCNCGFVFHKHYETIGKDKNNSYQNSYNNQNNNYKQPNRNPNLDKIELSFAKTLGLKGKITTNTIKKAYKARMKEYHPDKVANLGEKLKELASKESKLINEAYEYFKNKYNIR